MNQSEKWLELVKSHLKSLKDMWKNLPEQVTRIILIVIFFVVVFFVARYQFVPDDFGEHGHYRSSALEEISAGELKYAGQLICNECHDDIVEIKAGGYHKNVSCEVCHGPAAAHTNEPDEVTLPAPRERAYCPLCHEYLPSRPTGFPQIVSASHNPMSPCIQCHDPHEPEPPQIPKECSACHAQIARTKSLSHHTYVPCTRCHETPEEHKINPREFLPGKPTNREFCGGCHSIEADSQRGIPRVDLDSHERRYVCWQCHYPHLPEAR